MSGWNPRLCSVHPREGAGSRCHPMALPGTSWHYGTEPSFPNSEVTPVGYRIPGTASEAGGELSAISRQRVEH